MIGPHYSEDEVNTVLRFALAIADASEPDYRWGVSLRAGKVVFAVARDRHDRGDVLRVEAVVSLAALLEGVDSDAFIGGLLDLLEARLYE